MKTVDKIKQEIQSIFNSYNNGRDLKPSQKKKLSSRLQFLRTCLSYLEGHPDEEFVEKEKRRLETRLEEIKNGYIAWKNFNYGEEKKLLEEYNKMMRRKLCETQLRCLKFLLS